MYEDLVDYGITPVSEEEVDYFGDFFRHYHAVGREIGTGNFYHIGIYAAGTDGVDPDIILIVFSGKAFGESEQGVLTGSIDALQRVSGVGDYGSDIDYGCR